MTPLVTEDDVTAVSDQMRSFWIGRGVRVAELERLMAEWVGAKYAVAFGSGTAALVAALARLTTVRSVGYPADACQAVPVAIVAAGLCPAPGDRGDATIALYPYGEGDVMDYALCLPCYGETTLKARFGVFSFGALKDVSGGIGGCLVSNEPIEAENWKRISPLSDINAAMILSQLGRYGGKVAKRLVADGKVWEMAA